MASEVIAALFPGQGSQAIGMAQNFYQHSAAAKAVLDEAEATMPGLLELMWQGPIEKLTLTANQQPALVAASTAAFAAYLEAGGQEPSFVAGHSLGEFSAYVAADALTVAEAVSLVHKRGRYMQEAVPEGQGAMAAVLKSSEAVIRDICEQIAGTVEIANLNTPSQTVISGDAEAVAEASARLKESRARVIPLKVSAPFHCRLMQPAADQLAEDLEALSFKPLRYTLISNVSASALDNPADSATRLTEQVTQSVRWVESVQHLASLGVTGFIEFGSGAVLSKMVGQIIKGAKAQAVTDMASLQEVL